MRIVLIHGLGQTSCSWDKTLTYMGETYPVDCPDLTQLLQGKEPGYGNLYAAFSEHCNRLEEPLCLCGLSLGGILALHYALDQPERVRSMILIGAQYRMPKALLHIQNALFELLPKSSFQSSGFSKNGLNQLSKSLMSLDFSSRIEGIQCDTLILCGEKDKFNKKAAQQLANYIPGAVLRLVEGAGHEVNVDAPEALASIINTFLAKNILI